MKKLKLILGLALAAMVTGQAHAVLSDISGSIAFTGEFATDSDSDFTSATAFTSITAVTGGPTSAGTGDYSVLPTFTPLTFNTFSFSDTGVAPLWSIINAGTTYSFDATTVNVTTQTINALIISGSGIGSISGVINRNDTAGSWIVTADKSGASFQFSSTAVVPDSGATAALLGLGLIGLAGAARRFKK